MKKRLVDSFLRSLLFSSLVVILVSACSVVVGKPTVIILSPPSGSEVREGQTIAVQSTASDPSGVARVELTVDSAIVRSDPLPNPQASYTISQTWTAATPGNHTIIVRAYNKVNVASEPAAIAVSVLPAVAAEPTLTPPPTATLVLGVPTVVPTNAPAGCTNDSRFVADVTIPDGTSISSSQTFDKIWRLSNTGTCAWATGYRLSFVGGTAMTPNTVVNVPATAPGATADIKVPMTAPATGGSYTGNWQMRSSANTLFGPRVTVVVNVPAPTAPPTGCSITSFTASPLTINAGEWTTLTWGAVLNAVSAEIDQGIGGIETPGTRVVQPTMTTTYTLIAHCGTYNRTAQVTVNVNYGSGCSGSPNITYFNASNTTITLGNSTTLNWGAVTNADSVEIDPNVGGVATPGSASVTPTEKGETTYTITARCRTRASTRTVTIKVE